MRPVTELQQSRRLQIVQQAADGFAAYLVYPTVKPGAIAIIASWGGGWEHVSVSLARRCPTWEEMCIIK